MRKQLNIRLCNQRGFTLIELTLVVLLLGLLANLSLPLISGFETNRMKAAARRISGTVKYLYNEAIMTGREQRLIFDISQKTYRTIEIADNGELLENTGPGRLFRLPETVSLKLFTNLNEGSAERERSRLRCSLTAGWRKQSSTCEMKETGS